MTFVDKRDTVCVVGAGASGITAIKNLMELDIPVEGIEREAAVGGNWIYGARFSSVYASAHLISSKPLTEYTDFPFPDDYPDYPSHNQVLAYLRRYAEHFGVTDRIRFKSEVRWVSRSEEDGCWDVELDDGSTHRYRALIIANGHHWDPKYPPYAGQFA
ncbi:MAG: NAD(P)-binding domain-containing protein, partial [Anaerolineae bacterium]